MANEVRDSLNELRKDIDLLHHLHGLLFRETVRQQSLVHRQQIQATRQRIDQRSSVLRGRLFALQQNAKSPTSATLLIPVQHWCSRFLQTLNLLRIVEDTWRVRNQERVMHLLKLEYPEATPMELEQQMTSMMMERQALRERVRP